MKRKLLQLLIIQICFILVIILLNLYGLLALDFCTGTGTGLNYIYMVCKEEIWLPLFFITQFLLTLMINSLIIFKVKSRKYKLILLLGSLILLLLTSIFYNTDLFKFFWFWNVFSERAIG